MEKRICVSMKQPDIPLEIRLYLIDGSQACFKQMDAGISQRIVSQIQPERIFSQPYLAMAGASSLTGIPCSKVAAIEFVTEVYPGWAFPKEISDIVEITEDSFRAGFISFRQALRIRAQTPEVGDPYVSYGELLLAGGKKIHVEVHGVIRNIVEQRRLVHQVFYAPCLTARRREGGALLVNPANLLTVEFSPGPREAPNTAWPAESTAAWREE